MALEVVMAGRMGPGAAVMAATICQRFYVEGDSKSKIASDLGLSRFQVARLLGWSIREGIIRFQISTPGMLNAELSETVRRVFGLQRAVVIEIPERDAEPTAIRQRVGRAAAAVLTETVTENDVLGVGWGRTLNEMARELTEIARCPVVQMGGMLGSVHENALELVRKISAVGGGEAFPLFVPMIVEDEQAAHSLRRQPGIAAATRLFDSITVAAVSVGSWNPADSQLLDSLDPSKSRELISRGVVGEVCSTLLCDDGSTVSDLESRSIAADARQLRGIRDLILVAGGAAKAHAVHAAIRAGLGTTLVTDSALARALLRRV